jgi:hypothetical protein
MLSYHRLVIKTQIPNLTIQVKDYPDLREMQFLSGDSQNQQVDSLPLVCGFLTQYSS